MMDFHTYIKAVGTGPKGNRDLSLDESFDMMSQVLNQEVYSEQIAAFLLGWRLKPETIDEFLGALKACKTFITHSKVENSIELGFPYDGKVKTPYLFPLAAKLLQEKLNVVLSGDLMTPAKNGLRVQELQNALSLPSNVHYFDRKEYFPAMHKLSELRMRLGVRTGINTIEKLPNIGKSAYGITGLFHKPYVQKYMAIFSHAYERFALIQGSEGSPELFKKGHLWVSDADGVQEIVINPQYYGIDVFDLNELSVLEATTQNYENPDEIFMKLARLNAAIYLFVAQKAPSVDDAFEMLQ